MRVSRASQTNNNGGRVASGRYLSIVDVQAAEANGPRVGLPGQD